MELSKKNFVIKYLRTPLNYELYGFLAIDETIETLNLNLLGLVISIFVALSHKSNILLALIFYFLVWVSFFYILVRVLAKNSKLNLEIVLDFLTCLLLSFIL